MSALKYVQSVLSFYSCCTLWLSTQTWVGCSAPLKLTVELSTPTAVSWLLDPTAESSTRFALLSLMLCKYTWPSSWVVGTHAPTSLMERPTPAARNGGVAADDVASNLALNELSACKAKSRSINYADHNLPKQCLRSNPTSLPSEDSHHSNPL